MIDTHCHIDLYENPIEIINECERLGILTIGVTNLPSHFELGFKHVQNLKKVRLALGMHPLYAEFHTRELPAFIKNIEKTSYIGEIGLDFSKEGVSTKSIQLSTFTSILNLIKGKNKLLSLHSRKAERDVLNYLLKFEVSSAIFHWYSGPVQLIKEISENGYFFSVNTAMTQSKNGREIIQHIPESNMLTESDGPFVQFQGKTIRPSNLGIVIKYLSLVWKISQEEVEQKIDDNFKRMIKQISK